MNTDQSEEPKTFTELERAFARRLLEGGANQILGAEDYDHLASAYYTLNKAALLSRLNGVLSPENAAELVNFIKDAKAKQAPGAPAA